MCLPNFRIRKRRVSMAKMKVVQVPKPGADFEIVERDIPNPTAGHVRIRVQACGTFQRDTLLKEGHWPGIQSPRASILLSQGYRCDRCRKPARECERVRQLGWECRARRFQNPLPVSAPEPLSFLPSKLSVFLF